MWLLILGLFLFVLLVVVHEYGHFLVAKRNGVDVEEFGVGFPPKLFGKTIGKGIFRCYYTINLLPLGGFVKLKGEHDADITKGAYGAASLPAKYRIMLAGVAMNLIVALVMFTILAWIGMPQIVPNQYKIKSDSNITKEVVISANVTPGSPAANVGIVPGSVINTINNQPIVTADQLRVATSSNAGKTVPISYSLKGKVTNTKVSLLTTQEVEASLETDSPKGYLGVVPTPYVVERATWSAPIQAVGLTIQFTVLTLKGLATIVANLAQALGHAVVGDTKTAKQEASDASQNVSGPVGIFVILKQGTTLGIEFILFIIAIISLTLAIMNALPIPALDGGRAFVTFIFHTLKKPLLPKTEEWIHGGGFVALMLLFVLITFVDIKRFF
jgi:regulator of sigma E protease